MMVELLTNLPLACDGCFKGYPAVISLVIIVVTLIGSIYMLLASNFGARVGYLIVMVSLGAYMIFMSLLWTIGGPGTTTGTGPRGREPAWIPFRADSEFAADFTEAIDAFPQSWNQPKQGELYPGNVEPSGEITTAGTTIKTALANDALLQANDGKPYTKTQLQSAVKEWNFLREGQEAVTDEEKALPVATVRFLQHDKGLLMGITIPATDDHREVTVFAYRDKGLVYLYSVYFLGVSILIFVLHLWLLARHERKQKALDAELEPALA